MWSKAIKTFFSTLTFGSAAGGGGFAIFQLINNRKSNRSARKASTNVTPKDIAEDKGTPDNKPLKKELQAQKQSVEEKEEKLATPEETSSLSESLQAFEGKQDSQALEEGQHNSEKIHWDAMESENHLKQQPEAELVSFEEEQENDLQNTEEDVQALARLEEQEKEQKRIFAIQREQEIKELSLKAEQEKSDIYLEAVWMFSAGGSLSKYKSCVLIRKDHPNKDIPLMIEGSENVDDDELCGETSWYRQKEFEYEREGLWIRGKKDAVRKLIKVNWEDFQGSGFIKKGLKEPDFISENFTELSDLCNIDIKNGEDWVEIKCLAKTLN